MYGTFTLYGTSFQRFLLTRHVPFSCSYYPVYAIIHIRFGLFPVRSPLLRESLLFSLPAGTKMFQFPAFALHIYQWSTVPSKRWVVPFGDWRINGYLLLHVTFRSLSRPSSPLWAKASTMRPYLLLLYTWYRIIIFHNIITPTTYALILSVVINFLAIFYSLSCVNMSKISFTYVKTDKRQYKKPKGSNEYSP